MWKENKISFIIFGGIFFIIFLPNIRNGLIWILGNGIATLILLAIIALISIEYSYYKMEQEAKAIRGKQG